MRDTSLCLSNTQGAVEAASSEAQEGQSLIELALLLPVLVLIMAGMLDLGRAFQAYTVVVNAAREGARYGAYNPTDSYGILDRVQQEANESGVDLSQSTVIIEMTNVSPGVPIKVTVIYQFQPVMGLILGGQSISIRGSVSVVQF
ncbi:MAG: TadE family protein [Anaerolineae bacterium]